MPVPERNPLGHLYRHADMEKLCCCVCNVYCTYDDIMSDCEDLGMYCVCTHVNVLFTRCEVVLPSCQALVLSKSICDCVITLYI